MSSRSIVDRVLLFAAAVCAAGLMWQLTVLMTSKNHASSFHRLETVSAASAQTSDAPATVAPVTPLAVVAASASPSPIRVVYADGSSTKSTGKATDIAEVPSAPPPGPAATRSIDLPVTTAPADAPRPVAPVVKPTVGVTTASVAEDDAAPVTTSADSAAPPPANVASLAPPATPAAAASAPSPDGKQVVNINRASIDELNHLAGAGRIGQAIASHRPYRSVEELLKKRVVRRNVYDHIKGQLAAE